MICSRVQLLGNPTSYATWEDESKNRELAEIGKAQHSASFERRLLAAQAGPPKAAKRQRKS